MKMSDNDDILFDIIITQLVRAKNNFFFFFFFFFFFCEHVCVIGLVVAFMNINSSLAYQFIHETALPSGKQDLKQKFRKENMTWILLIYGTFESALGNNLTSPPPPPLPPPSLNLSNPNTWESYDP